jgi:hypothetical protein
MEKKYTGTIISLNDTIVKVIKVSNINGIKKGDTVRLTSTYDTNVCVFKAIVTSIDYEREEFECAVFDEKWF